MTKPRNTDAPRRLSLWILGGFVLVSLAFLVILQTSNLWKEFSVDTASDTLLLYALSSLNFIAFVVFGFIFLRSIIKLLRERRALQLGSKIKTRLLIYFAAISLLPIIAMAGFSYLFMNRALERWFTQIPENVVREARKVQTMAIAEQAAGLRQAAEMLALGLDGKDISEEELDRLASAGGLMQVEIRDADGRVIAKSSPAAELAGAEGSREMAAVRENRFDEPALHDGVGIDAAASTMADGRRLVLVTNFRFESSVSQMVDSALTEFDLLKEKQRNVQRVGFLTLGVLTFLLIFASTWTAFYIARGLTVPIKALAEGADRIAQGDLSHRVDVLAEDELALLVAAFNEMSQKLEQNSAELSERRKYIETILQSLPTGVISFDADNRVSTINRSAVKLFRLEDADFGSMELQTLLNEENRTVIERLIARAKRVGHASEQTKLRRENTAGRADGDAELAVALIATSLPNGGAVLVIEDLSELLAAQRASAWQEVARRMAHEIKNPLTPIQLSAERIAKRFTSEPPALAGGFGTPSDKRSFGTRVIVDDPNAKVVLDGTETILREVQSLKAMVDEFSRFARLPDARLEPGDLNSVIVQAVQLYEDRENDLNIELALDADLPSISLDPEQMKRVFVNLIDNAVEAADGDGGAAIEIRTRREHARDIVVAEVCDLGPGIDPADYQKLFQPYFSTKGRGTGLGLAIVRRIIAEHNGKITTVPNKPRGAKFIIELPVAA